MYPSEITEIYLDAAYPIDSPYPGLSAAFDDPITRLREDLFGWDMILLDKRHILWSCPDRLAVVLVEISEAIHLFTFTEASDFERCLDLLRSDWNL